METHSDTNYPLAEEQIAESMVQSFHGTNEHNVCVLRINDADNDNLDYARIAQLIQDELEEEVSWRELAREEVALIAGEDIGDDHIVVFKRDELEVPEEDDSDGE